MYIQYAEYNKNLLIRPSDNKSEVKVAVEKILQNVREKGDEALFEYAREFDNSFLSSLYASEEEFVEAERKVPEDIKRAILKAKENIEKFHKAQIHEGESLEISSGIRCWRKIVPINKVGLYVPGGTAPLFSTVLMLAIPAVIAGVKDIILATPSKGGKVNPEVLFSARIAGVGKVLKVGGTQAIAAFGYGTESIEKRDKIFGPGNSYVTEAKKQISMYTQIDMPAGPSEVMVVADKTSNPAFVASDLLSQAEHGKDSQVMLLIIAEDERKARDIYLNVEKEMGKEIAEIGRHEYMLPSLSHSYAFHVRGKSEAIEIINEYAPEHLIISTEDPASILEYVENAGSVFLGSYSPESAGDYASGTNHTLPTSGWAKSYSGVSVDSFIKKITVQELTRDGLFSIADVVEAMAEREGLMAHSYAVKVRRKV